MFGLLLFVLFLNQIPSINREKEAQRETEETQLIKSQLLKSPSIKIPPNDGTQKHRHSRHSSRQQFTPQGVQFFTQSIASLFNILSGKSQELQLISLLKNTFLH